MNALTIVDQSNVELYRRSTDAAELCREIVVATAVELGGRKYVQLEGWQAVAVAHGCALSARLVERVDGGFRAVGEVRRMSDGSIIAEAEGFVGEDEPVWFGGSQTNKWGTKIFPRRYDYAIRAMAQTRAMSRAARSAFAHVVVMMKAGLSTTPAEEVPEGGFEDHAVASSSVKTTPAKEVKPLTLAERADAFEAKLRAAPNVDRLDKVFSLGSGLMAELDDKNPERFAVLDTLHRELLGKLSAAAQSTPFDEEAA